MRDDRLSNRAFTSYTTLVDHLPLRVDQTGRQPWLNISPRNSPMDKPGHILKDVV